MILSPKSKVQRTLAVTSISTLSTPLDLVPEHYMRHCPVSYYDTVKGSSGWSPTLFTKHGPRWCSGFLGQLLLQCPRGHCKPNSKALMKSAAFNTETWVSQWKSIPWCWSPCKIIISKGYNSGKLRKKQTYILNYWKVHSKVSGVYRQIYSYMQTNIYSGKNLNWSFWQELFP